MSSIQTTIRTAATQTVEGRWAVADKQSQVLAIVDYWSKQSNAKVLRTIEAYPELQSNKSLLLDLILKEYELRKGQPALTREEFCDQFSHLDDFVVQSIVRAVEVQEYLDANPQLLGLIPDFGWPEPGAAVQGFQIIEELGRGALARAYLCRESGLGQRNVVLKIARGSGLEAEFLGRLDHPNIVPVYSVKNDAEQSVSYICMPYRGRSTLQELVSRVRQLGVPKRASVIIETVCFAVTSAQLNGRDAKVRQQFSRISYIDGVLQIATQLADALTHAHGVGVYHGDLKPSNVLLTNDGIPLLIDFNLAADRDSGISPRGGTLAYMPPEQLAEVSGELVSGQYQYDARSEVYSFGALLYELLTGCVPYPVPSATSTPKDVAMELLRQQKARVARIGSANPNVNSQLDQLVSRCLELNPDNRPQSMAELLRALKQQSSHLARIERLRHARPVLTNMLAIIAASLLIGGSFYLCLRPSYHVRQLANGIEASQSGDFDSAITYFDEALKDGAQQHKALYERGRAHLRQGDLASAGTDLSAVWKEYTDPRAAALVGYCFSRQGQHSSAIPWYEKSLEGGVDSASMHNNLGVSYMLGRRALGPAGQVEKARLHLQRALSIDPTSLITRENLVTFVLTYADECTPEDLVEAHTHLEVVRESHPRSTRVMADSVQLYCLLSLNDQTFVDRSIHAIDESLRSGYGPTARELSLNPRFARLRTDSRFKNLESLAPSAVKGSAQEDLGMFISPLADAQ